MVVFQHHAPTIVNVYSTVPLSAAAETVIKNGFYDGSQARYGNPMVVPQVHSETKYHGLSHYDLRLLSDSSGNEHPIMVADDRTAESGALWYVDTTVNCKSATEDFPEREKPPVIYPGEKFALWHLRMRAVDIPLSFVAWGVGCGSMSEQLYSKVPPPYDERNPQNEPWASDFDWTNPETAANSCGDAFVLADWDEMEWTWDPEIIKHWSPRLPGARLTAEAAEKGGLKSTWVPILRVPKLGEQDFRLQVPYDPYNPKWPTGYPDDWGSANRTKGNSTEIRLAPGVCQRWKQKSDQSARTNASVAVA